MMDKNSIAEMVQVRADVFSIKECLEFVQGREFMKTKSASALIENINELIKNGIEVKSSIDGSTKYAHTGDYVAKDIHGNIDVVIKEEFESD